MKVLLDLNVVLDVILNRQPWFNDSAYVWNSHQSGSVTCHLIATELTNLFYVVNRLAGEAVARTAVHTCLATFEILPVDRMILENAGRLPGSDFEDNVCIAGAIEAKLDLIVTRDTAGFAGSPVPAVTPAELILRLP